MGKALSSITGGGGGSSAKPAQPYAPVQFQPYSYTNQVGTTTGTKNGNSFNFASTIDPRLASLGQSGLNQTQPFLDTFLQNARRPLSMFGGVGNAEDKAADIFRTQSALLQPQFDLQNQQLANNVFGSGRLGLQLAGQTAGAGDVGMVQPDAYGLGRAQSRALAELSSAARQQAQGEQQQEFNQAFQSFGVNEDQKKQQLANLLAGYTGSLGAFDSVAQMEQALVNQGSALESARSGSYAGSASAGAALANAGTKEIPNSGGLFEAFGTSFGDKAAGGLTDMIFGNKKTTPTGQNPNSQGLTGQSTNSDWASSLNFLGGDGGSSGGFLSAFNDILGTGGMGESGGYGGGGGNMGGSGGFGDIVGVFGGGGRDGGSKDTTDWLMDAAQVAMMVFSDKQLKTNITKIGQLASGLNTYSWDWKEHAKELVGNQPAFGVIAQEVQKIFPQAVSMNPSGYLQVDYARIS
jgi:hypothetical protein